MHEMIWLVDIKIKQKINENNGKKEANQNWKYEWKH